VQFVQVSDTLKVSDTLSVRVLLKPVATTAAIALYEFRRA
jgi:hypothetical protein